jgi:hypothetical protein
VSGDGPEGGNERLKSGTRLRRSCRLLPGSDVRNAPSASSTPASAARAKRPRGVPATRGSRGSNRPSDFDAADAEYSVRTQLPPYDKVKPEADKLW